MAASENEVAGESGRTKPTLVVSDLALSKEQEKKLVSFVKRGADIEEKAKSLKGLKAALMDEVEDAELDRDMVKRCIKARSIPKEDRAYDQQKFDFYMGVIERADPKN